MTSSHFNTTHETGRTLAQFEGKAASQEALLMALFRAYVSPFSPSEAHRMLRSRAPLTSIRRAMTNLTAQGLLVRTEQKASGPYGRPEFRWRLRVEPSQGRLI